MRERERRINYIIEWAVAHGLDMSSEWDVKYLFHFVQDHLPPFNKDNNPRISMCAEIRECMWSVRSALEQTKVASVSFESMKPLLWKFDKE